MTTHKQTNKNKPRNRKREESVVIYHDMAVYENFERCARRIWEMIKGAQDAAPGKPRQLFLDVQGHRNAAGGYDRDALEIINEFTLGFLLPYLTEATTSFHRVRNKYPQQNDLADLLEFSYPEDDERFWYNVDLLPLRPRETSASDSKGAPTLKAIADYLGMDACCLVCWGKPAERAHVVPQSLGGSMDVRNFALLCAEHHRQAPDIADAEAFWAWVDYAEIRDSGSKWTHAPENVKQWIQALGVRTGIEDREEQKFLTAVRVELERLYTWSDDDFSNTSWDLLHEYHLVLEAATSKHFGVDKKVSTHAWAYHIARRRLAQRSDKAISPSVDHPWTGM